MFQNQTLYELANSKNIKKRLPNSKNLQAIYKN